MHWCFLFCFLHYQIKDSEMRSIVALISLACSAAASSSAVDASVKPFDPSALSLREVGARNTLVNSASDVFKV